MVGGGESKVGHYNNVNILVNNLASEDAIITNGGILCKLQQQFLYLIFPITHHAPRCVR
jgi:hypothetical protein